MAEDSPAGEPLGDAELLAAFCAATLPRSAWTHEAHLRIGYLHLRAEGLEAALLLVRARIQALNAAHGTPETITRGYHETITVAYLRLIAAALAADHTRDEIHDHSFAFLAAHPELAVRERLLDFYSRERLFSPEAKRGFLEPDRQPLP